MEKRELKKKKAYVATWDDYASSFEEEQTKDRTKLCLIALEEEEEQEVNLIKPSDYSNLPYDELLEAFHELMHDSTFLAKRLNNMKFMHKNLNGKHHERSKVIATLKSKNSLLTSS